MKLNHGLVWPLLAIAVGCGALTKKEDHIVERNTYTERNDTGCVQGVIMNALTNERIPLTGLKADEGVFVLAHTAHLSAAPASGDDYLKGEFVLCGVPLDDAFPIFARFGGYGEFYSHIHIDSTLAQKSPQASVDIRKPSPTLIANIRMYPVGVETQDLKFTVSYNGAAVQNATVRLTPQGQGYFDDAQFLSPLNYASQSQIQKTNSNGEATFGKEGLALGAAYSYDVLPADGGAIQTAQSGDLTLGLGQLKPGQSTPYTVGINLADARVSGLAKISSSLDAGNYDPQGRVQLVFNRPIRIIPGTEDKQTAFLSNAVKAKIPANVAGNGAPEQMKVTVTGTTLTIEPIFETPADGNVEAGLTVTYSGIEIGPVDGPANTTAIDLGSMTVKLFGGNNQPVPYKFAQTLELTSGSGQTATIGDTLSQPLKARVYDQFGDPFAGQSVRFQLDAGNGGGSLSTYQATTAADGYVTATWALGKLVGTQKVTVVSDSAQGGVLKNAPLSYTATAQDRIIAKTMTLVDGSNNQTAKVGMALPKAVSVLVVDQTGQPFAGQKVIFERVGAVPGTILSPDTPVTDANGIASMQWTLGSTVGVQSIVVHAVNVNGDTIATLPVSATATAAQ